MTDTNTNTTYDYDLRGFFRLRLNNATEREAHLVQRQVGPIAVAPHGQPDMMINFVDTIPDNGDLRILGLNEAAYNDHDFYILKGKNKSRVKVQIPFEQIGQPNMTITCERGLSSVPLLIALINLTLLSKGILPFHASAFHYAGQGVLVTGWAKGGKTETLLAFMANGARYIGDEWIYLQPEANQMFGIPEPMRIWNWHLNSLPQYKASLKQKDRARLASLDALSRSMGWLAGPEGGQPAGLVGRMLPMVNRQMYTHFAPQTLFGAEHMQTTSPIDRLIFAVSHSSDDVRVLPIEAEEVAERMMFSLMEEQAGLLAAYRQFRFAFPQRCNSWIDSLERIQYKHLTRALKDLPAYVVYHPYPVEIPRLYEALSPYFDAQEGAV